MHNSVFAQVLAGFRYGRDDLDVLGLNFRRDLIDVSCSLVLAGRIACLYMYNYSGYRLSSCSDVWGMSGVFVPAGESSGVPATRPSKATTTDITPSSAPQKTG